MHPLFSAIVIFRHKTPCTISKVIGFFLSLKECNGHFLEVWFNVNVKNINKNSIPDTKLQVKSMLELSFVIEMQNTRLIWTPNVCCFCV